MLTIEKLPLSLVDVSPRPDAERYQGIRIDKQPDGQHTGGVWVVDDYVWKPTDVLAYMGADHRVESWEVRCLTELAGTDLFPRNFNIVTSNGRRWIVRKMAHVHGQSQVWSPNAQQDAARIRAALVAMNRRQWKMNDLPVVAMDREMGEMFFLDLSSAAKVENHTVSDEPHWRELVRAAWPRMNIMHFEAEKAKSEVLNELLIRHDTRHLHMVMNEHAYVYRGTKSYGPREEARVGESGYMHTLAGKGGEIVTWLFAQRPLSFALCRDLEIVLCKEPWG